MKKRNKLISLAGVSIAILLTLVIGITAVFLTNNPVINLSEDNFSSDKLFVIESLGEQSKIEDFPYGNPVENGGITTLFLSGSGTFDQQSSDVSYVSYGESVDDFELLTESLRNEQCLNGNVISESIDYQNISYFLASECNDESFYTVYNEGNGWLFFATAGDESDIRTLVKDYSNFDVNISTVSPDSFSE